MLFLAFYGLDNSEIHQSSNETMDSVKGHLIQSLSYVRQHCSKCTKASRPLLCLPGSPQTESDVTCVVLDQSVRDWNWVLVYTSRVIVKGKVGVLIVQNIGIA